MSDQLKPFTFDDEAWKKGYQEGASFVPSPVPADMNSAAMVRYLRETWFEKLHSQGRGRLAPYYSVWKEGFEAGAFHRDRRRSARP